MRRQHLAKITHNTGYDDSRHVLSGGDGWGEGSCNQLLLGDSVIRPFKGFTSKGANTGTQVMSQVGSSWGGLKKQASASGSLVEDFSKTLYAIGAGYLSKEGVTMQAQSGTITIDSATDINIGTSTFTENTHGFATGNQLRYSATSSAAIPGLSVGTTYFVIVLTANTFKLALNWANAHAGTAITLSGAGTGTQTFIKGADMTASSQLKVASVQLSDYLYKYYDSAGLAQPDAPTLEVPATVGGNYTGLIDGAISFKLAAIRDRANAGLDLDNVAADVKSIASSTSAVVVAVRKTVKITFPTAETGQTHWAVFATKAGFGGTGIHYRIGYRTTSSESSTWIWGIPEETVAAATNRTLEFDFKDGDLYPEEAWLFDYVPPQGSHFLRLENVGIVLGCYDGTVGAVSLPNFFESYHPRHLIYFPESVTATLSRPVDDFAYVATRNSIHALQYVGFRGDDLPSCTVTTITPDVGIAYQQNWASGMGLIAAWIEGAGIVLISNDGKIDYEFGKEVSYLTKGWTAVDVKVGFDPATRSFVFAHGKQSVSFCLQSNAWSAPVYLSDHSVTGNWLSAINSRGEMIVTVDNSGTHTAYSYDSGISDVQAVSISRWQNVGTSARSANIYEIQASMRYGTPLSFARTILGIHQNLQKTHIRGVSTTASSATITSSGLFTLDMNGKQVVLFGASLEGVGTYHAIAKFNYSTASTGTLTNISTGLPVTLSATRSDILMLIGEDFYEFFPEDGDQHLLSFYPQIQDARSYAVSCMSIRPGAENQVIEIDVFGTLQGTSEAKA